MPKLSKKEETTIKLGEGLFKIGMSIAEHSKKEIVYVDRKMTSEKDAGHLITFRNEEQIGRDIENYRIFSSLLGPEYALLSFLEEIILPIRKYLSENDYQFIEDEFKNLAKQTISEKEYKELLTVF
jgi:hypothetical protein